MSWNYRLVRHVEAHPLHENNPQKIPPTQTWFAVHTAYYAAGTAPDGPPCSVSVEPTLLAGETVAELRDDLGMILLAFSRPVVDYDRVGDDASGDDAQATEGTPA